MSLVLSVSCLVFHVNTSKYAGLFCAISDFKQTAQQTLQNVPCGCRQNFLGAFLRVPSTGGTANSPLLPDTQVVSGNLLWQATRRQVASYTCHLSRVQMLESSNSRSKLVKGVRTSGFGTTQSWGQTPAPSVLSTVVWSCFYLPPYL